MVIYVVSLAVLPIWSIVILTPLLSLNLINCLSVLFVMLFQLITLITFMNYFSASLVKREIINILYVFSEIVNHINCLLINNRTIEDKEFNKLKEKYFNSNRYVVSSDDSLLVTYYNLRPNPTYLSFIQQKDNSQD
jgi:hypothetical protein